MLKFARDDSAHDVIITMLTQTPVVSLSASKDVVLRSAVCCCVIVFVHHSSFIDVSVSASADITQPLVRVNLLFLLENFVAVIQRQAH